MIIPAYFNMFPGQGMVMFKVTPCVKWRWGCIPTIRMRVDFGVSLCSPRDVYDTSYGKDLAENRIYAFLEGRDNLVRRGLAGSWTMARKPWLEALDNRREQEVLYEIWAANFPIKLPFTWERMVN